MVITLQFRKIRNSDLRRENTNPIGYVSIESYSNSLVMSVGKTFVFEEIYKRSFF